MTPDVEKENDARQNKPDVEKRPDQVLLPDLRKWFGDRLLAVFMGVSALGHGVAMGRGDIEKVVSGVRSGVFLDGRKYQGVARLEGGVVHGTNLGIEKLVSDGKISAEHGEFLNIEKEFVKRRNAGREINARKLENLAGELKFSYLKNPHFTPEFALEFERVVIGIEEKIGTVAKDELRKIVDAMKQVDNGLLRGKVNEESVQGVLKMFNTSRQENTLANASDALVLRSRGIFANCNSRDVLIPMVILSLNPDLNDRIRVQEFGDHSRALIRLDDGREIILEGIGEFFPDSKSLAVTSRVMPIDQYWRGKFGVAENELKEVKFFGPKSSENFVDYPRVTDQVVASAQSSRKLGNYRNGEDDKKKNSGQRREDLEKIEDLLKEIGEIGTVPMEIELINFEKLDLNAAEKMIKEKNFQMLRFYEDVDLDALQELAKSEEFIRAAIANSSDAKADNVGFGMKVLSDSFLNKFVSVPWSEGQVIRFIGVESLSVLQAKKLANLKVRAFDFVGLKSIDLEVAEAISKFKGGGLGLSGFNVINADVAKSLAAFQGKKLLMNGLENIDVDVAKGLSQFRREGLSLSGLKSINADVAKEFAGFNGKTLYLDGLENIDVDVAKGLSQFRGEELGLTGLKSINADVAKELSKIQGFRVYIKKNAQSANVLNILGGSKWIQLWDQ